MYALLSWRLATCLGPRGAGKQAILAAAEEAVKGGRDPHVRDLVALDTVQHRDGRVVNVNQTLCEPAVGVQND